MAARIVVPRTFTGVRKAAWRRSNYGDRGAELLDDLSVAIPRNELVLHYQPKVDLTTGRCSAVEALLRWRHPRQGLIFPDAFIPLAEQSGLIIEVTNWVVREAIRQSRVWQDLGLFLSVAVNISAGSLTDDSLLPTFRSALDEFRVSPFSVEIELTETGVMENPMLALVVLERFDELGIHASIDDFGTGFSSLVYLRDLPVHTLKIDKSFVMGMGANDRNAPIIRSTIALAHALGLRVVAEGVEDAESAAALHEAGCDIGQGYFWSRALPADALVEWLHAFRTELTDRKLTSQMTKDQLFVQATRRLIAATTSAQLGAVLTDFVTELGGGVVDADEAYGPDVMQVDLSLGEGEALLPVALQGTLARRHLDELLPTLLSSAQLALSNQTRNMQT